MHGLSADDEAFRAAFEALRVPPDEFDHRAHLRLAYVYLCEGPAAEAHARMRHALQRYLEHLGAEPDRYHDTVTGGWIRAVRHFMERSEGTDSFAAFLDRQPRLLDRDLLEAHYSARRIGSDEARRGYVDPDVAPFPEDF